MDNDPKVDKEGFQKPRRTAKMRKVRDHTDVTTTNSYSDLDEDTDMDTALPVQNKNNNNKNKTNLGNNKSATKYSPKIKPPPIYAQLLSTKDAILFLKNNNISATKFTIKEYDSKLINISTNDIETYDATIKCMKDKAMEYFTFTPRYLKIKPLVLRGVRRGYNQDDVAAALTELNLPDVKMNKVSKLIFNKETPNHFHFIVTLSHDSLAAPLTRQKKLLNQFIRWERLKKPTIFQCKKCQQIGHASSNCNFKPRCSKCAEKHEVKDCPLKESNDKTKLCCINCGEQGHSAAYKGCPMLKMTTKIIKHMKQQNPSNKRNIANSINNYVVPGQTYANIINGPQAQSSHRSHPAYHQLNDNMNRSL